MATQAAGFCPSPFVNSSLTNGVVGGTSYTIRVSSHYCGADVVVDRMAFAAASAHASLTQAEFGIFQESSGKFSGTGGAPIPRLGYGFFGPGAPPPGLFYTVTLGEFTLRKGYYWLVWAANVHGLSIFDEGEFGGERGVFGSADAIAAGLIPPFYQLNQNLVFPESARFPVVGTEFTPGEYASLPVSTAEGSARHVLFAI